MQQQFSLPYEGIRHVLDLFMKSSSFTRYLLDDILPKEVFNNKKIIEEGLDNVLEECETLIVSLKTFKQLSKLLNLGKAVSSSSQNIQKQCIEQNGLVPVKLVESFQIISDQLKFTSNLKPFQLYYCELCDESSHLSDKVKEHFASERHTSALLSSSRSFSTHQCNSCGLFIMARQSFLNNIIDAEMHVTVDKTFESVMSNLVDKNVIKDEETSSVASDTGESFDSEDPNKNDEAAAEEKHKSNFYYNKNNRQRKSFFKDKWSISDVFIEINDRMLSGKIRYCQYCGACNQAFISAEDWYNHKQNQEHQKNSKVGKNYHEKCFNCPFHIFGPKPALNAYLRYHKEVNHIKTNTMNQFNKNKSGNMKQQYHSQEKIYNSRRKNSSDFSTEKCDVVKSYTKQGNPVSDDVTNLQEEENSYRTNEILLNRTYELKPFLQYKIIDSGEHSTKKDRYHSIFLDLVNYQKKNFKENNFVSLKGLCMLCCSIIKDEFEWIAHIKNFHHPNELNTEEECKTCQISVYGPAEIIHKELWILKEHHDLDKLVQ